ncbi:hypothetical protein ATANTOWER_012404 [Ataeniobius toweri]|uniref:Uncharacterized protein n=1 Tax=Ataeniobius toweri TaxID=208326 RepID=A0ABU7A771_9TELE|nr:hypothetical protein [Ataeniobius toweri]
MMITHYVTRSVTQQRKLSGNIGLINVNTDSNCHCYCGHELELLSACFCACTTAAITQTSACTSQSSVYSQMYTVNVGWFRKILETIVSPTHSNPQWMNYKITN